MEPSLPKAPRRIPERLTLDRLHLLYRQRVQRGDRFVAHKLSRIVPTQRVGGFCDRCNRKMMHHWHAYLVAEKGRYCRSCFMELVTPPEVRRAEEFYCRLLETYGWKPVHALATEVGDKWMSEREWIRRLEVARRTN